MRHAIWYFDPVSPFCYLQLRQIERLRVVLPIQPVPILFGAVLAHCGNVGPAEIPGKRLHTYRSVVWQAKRSGIALHFPPAHPFNPVTALRLCIALENRWEAIRAIFEQIWRDGVAGDSPAAFAALGARFGCSDVAAAVEAPAVKATLRANTEAAITAGVFGVPTVAVDDQLFWGNDSTALLEDFLVNPALFDSAEMRHVAGLPVGIERKR